MHNRLLAYSLPPYYTDLGCARFGAAGEGVWFGPADVFDMPTSNSIPGRQEPSEHLAGRLF